VKKCHYCGKANEEKSPSCYECGTLLPAADEADQDKAAPANSSAAAPQLTARRATTEKVLSYGPGFAFDCNSGQCGMRYCRCHRFLNCRPAEETNCNGKRTQRIALRFRRQLMPDLVG